MNAHLPPQRRSALLRAPAEPGLAHAEELREVVTRWRAIRTLVITDDRGQQLRLRERDDTIVVGTPLELIVALEAAHRLVSTVVLAGRFVLDHDLAGFLRDFYPELGVDGLGVEAW
jgi:hypothetical protein